MDMVPVFALFILVWLPIGAAVFGVMAVGGALVGAINRKARHDPAPTRTPKPSPMVSCQAQNAVHQVGKVSVTSSTT